MCICNCRMCLHVYTKFYLRNMCSCVYVCMHVCTPDGILFSVTYVFTCVFVNVYMYVCLFVCMHVCVPDCISIPHIHTYIHTIFSQCICSSAYIHKYACMHVVCTCNCSTCIPSPVSGFQRLHISGALRSYIYVFVCVCMCTHTYIHTCVCVCLRLPTPPYIRGFP